MKKIFRYSIISVFALHFSFSTLANTPINFNGSYSLVTNPHNDPNTPVSSGRSYFTTSTESAPEGFKLAVDMWHGEKNAPVSLWLQVAINDGSGGVMGIPILQLNDQVKDNPNNYHSHREFTLTYSEINEALQKILPDNIKNLDQFKIGPGSALFLYGYWHNYFHHWGSIGRGGLFFTPENASEHTLSQIKTSTQGQVRKASELDIAYPIGNLMAFKYNQVVNNEQVGLKVGGQIRSRLEAEGKYQVPLTDVNRIKRSLFYLSKNKFEAERVFGPDWTMKAELRYMKKDSNGNLFYDIHGFPIPDPMVDTYYDREDKLGAKNDIALRYRWTEGNETGAWNLKPGVAMVSAEGVMKRLEFGIDTTDDKPETIKAFADSLDPLNPLRMIRELVPNSTPSEFLKPSVKITDSRYKFKLQHKNGLVVEVSLDDVLAESFAHRKFKVRYAQLEADVDHMSTASMNVAQSAGSFSSLTGKLNHMETNFLNALTEKAFLDGRPVIHQVQDLQESSPVNQKHADDFKLAEQMITALRNYTVGKEWIPAPQKASLAAYLLGEIKPKEASRSVKAMSYQLKEQKLNTQNMFETKEIKEVKIMCRQALQ